MRAESQVSRARSRGQAQAQIRPEDVPELLGQGQERIRNLQRKLIGPQIGALGGTIGGTWGDLAQGALDMVPGSGYAWAEGKLPNVTEGGTFPDSAESWNEGDYLTWGLQKAAKAGDALSAAGIASALANPGIGAAMFLGGRAMNNITRKYGTGGKKVQKTPDGRIRALAVERPAEFELFDRANHQFAADLADAGYSQNEIKKVTNWHKAHWDSRMRFELSDADAVLKAKPEQFAHKDSAGRTRGYWETTLENVLDHPRLYEAYPELRDVDIVWDTARGDTLGWFNRDTDTIGLNIHRSPEEVKSTLLHEIQHWIQHKEGWTPGISPERAAAALHMWNAPEARRIVHETENLVRGQLQKANTDFPIWKAYFDSPEIQDAVAEIRRLQKKREVHPHNIDEKYKKLALRLTGKRWEDISADELGTVYEVAGPQASLEDFHKLKAERENLRKAWDDWQYGDMTAALELTGKDYELYRRMAGEAEARATQARANLDTVGRREAPLFSPEPGSDYSFDLPPDELIDILGGQ